MFWKRKTKRVYKITCLKCRHSWTLDRAPRGDIGCGINLEGKRSDVCPKCGHCGGEVNYADVE